MATLTYQNDLRNILALVLSILKISPLPPEMTWQTGHKSHCGGVKKSEKMQTLFVNAP